ncbi:Membrane proteinase PrsW, cleaves anti-sigma factor RsiW, M82 family [Nonomuraea maritima]|uniref:Membrane proteinase PrsW, cleaves anti-sigma factor RsiW, M82 family n=1 Tax=Nonomuraea maritima TaxID=683260 RepID=A0A1G9QG60_9ACTN|nr:PrsW family glutamic-type intramembrane protease [Nonomuraea maritima]SDM09477.1 Membrane proteinase PrsW, cleaves anti-sigma factor RsiW, M82 family [Nonomuraea maritima]
MKLRPPWLRVFVVGFVLWVASVVVTAWTSNSNLVPTVVLLGSFLVPVTFVVWAYAHGRSRDVTVERMFVAFIVGGVLGVLGASLLESWLVRPSVVMYVLVGLIEEAVKLAALIFVARRAARDKVRDGVVLGATVGFGFASFESAGYAFNALFTTHGLSLTQLVETEVLRGILTPVGHGLWTAIAGGVLFGARGRLTLPVLLTYLGVSLLHALWDSMSAIAIAITLVLTGRPWQFAELRIGMVPDVSPWQVHVYTVLHWAGLVLNSLIALVWLAVILARGRRRDVSYQ